MPPKPKQNVSNEYTSRSVPTTIQATSRASVKLGDNFYTFEYCEERQFLVGFNLEKERELLWADCHKEVDLQIEDIIKTLKGGKNN